MIVYILCIESLLIRGVYMRLEICRFIPNPMSFFTMVDANLYILFLIMKTHMRLLVKIMVDSLM